MCNFKSLTCVAVCMRKRERRGRGEGEERERERERGVFCSSIGHTCYFFFHFKINGRIGMTY